MSEPSRVGPWDRVFFALWPDGALRRRLARLVDRVTDACGGRGIRVDRLHLTLVFVGEVERERVDFLRALAASVVAPRIELTLDVLGYWRHNLIAWVGPSVVPEGLILLVRALEERLSAEGYSFDRRPYVPHVTLARNARCRGAQVLEEAIAWTAEEFVLARSVRGEEGASYEVVDRWPLGG